MNRVAKIYCWIAIFIAISFLVIDLVMLSGRTLHLWMYCLALSYLAWLPLSLIACVVFIVGSRFRLGVIALGFVAYVMANFLLTSKYPSPQEFHQSTTYGAIFFLIYGIANAWMLRQINKRKP